MSKRPARRALSMLCSTPWLILPEALEGIIEIASRQNLTPEAVEAQLGRPLENTHTVSMRDGVATIPVTGPIMRYGGLFSRISGATTVDTLATDLEAALADPEVKAICLAIDSPGGEANGISELADMIYAARGEKPMTAYVGGTGASAAYWIASAADEIVVDKMAVVGSIGVVTSVSKPDKNSDRLEIVSSQSPNKRPNFGTKQGIAQIQGVIDALGDVFVETVARNRGVTTDTVLSDYGQGGVFVGTHAVSAGLADRVGSYESVLAELQGDSMALFKRNAVNATADTPETDAVDLAADTSQENEDMTLPTQMTPPTGSIAATVFGPEMVDPLAESVEDMQTRLDEIQAELTAARTARETAEAKAAALEQEKVDADLATRASGWYGETATHVSILKALTAADPALAAAYEQNQNAQTTQVATGDLFKAKGVSGGDTATFDSAALRYDATVKAVAKERDIAYHEAAVLVDKLHPEIAEAYRAER